MKKYVSPEMKALAFEVEENIGTVLDPGPSGKTTNDAELAW